MIGSQFKAAAAKESKPAEERGKCQFLRKTLGREEKDGCQAESADRTWWHILRQADLYYSKEHGNMKQKEPKHRNMTHI